MNNFRWKAVDGKSLFDGKHCHWASSLMWVCHYGCFTPPRTKVRISPMHFASSSHSAISFNCQLLANTQIRSGMLPVQVSKLNFNVSTSQALRYNGVEKCMCICLVRSQSNNQKVIQQSSNPVIVFQPCFYLCCHQLFCLGAKFELIFLKLLAFV